MNLEREKNVMLWFKDLLNDNHLKIVTVKYD